MDSIPLKRCNRCGECHPATPEYFKKATREPNGVTQPCRNCLAKLTQDYYSRPDIQEKERKRKSTPEYKSHEREYKRSPAYRERARLRDKSPSRKARHREYLRDPEVKARLAAQRHTPEERAKRRDTQRKRRLNPVIRQRETEYRNRPDVKEMYRNHTQKRRSVARLLPSTMTISDKNKAIEYFGGLCPVCGRQFYDLLGDRTLSWDHWWVAQSNGGGFTADNMLPLCSGFDGCNNSKGNRDPVEWLADRYGKRKAENILNRIRDYFKHID